MSEFSAPPRTPANLAVLGLGCIVYVITDLAAAAMVPFFSVVALKRTGIPHPACLFRADPNTH